MSVISSGKKEDKKDGTKIRKSILRSLLNLEKITLKSTKFQFGSTTERRRRKKYMKEKKDVTPRRVNEYEIKWKIEQIMSRYKLPHDLCINALIQFPSYRNKEIIDLIKPYLKGLIGLMDIVSKEKSEDLSDKTLNYIATNLQYKRINKDRFICKYGEKGTLFYIILKGKVVFLVPKIFKCYLNESEYLSHLIKLRKNGENELLRNIISLIDNIMI